MPTISVCGEFYGLDASRGIGQSMFQGLTEQTQSAASQCDVMFVISALGVGGSERKIVRIASALAASGTRVSMVVLGPPYTLAADLHERITCVQLDRSARLSPRVVRQLQQQLRARRPRTVIAVDLFALLYASTALRAGGCGDPRRVALINTTTFVRKRDRVFMLGYAPLLRGSDLLVFGSGRQRADWTRRYRLGATPGCVIHNGVDLTRFVPSATAREDARRSLALPGTSVVIGSVGRLAPEKNQLAIITSAAQLHAAGLDVRVLLAGDGPMRAILAGEAARLGMASRLLLAGEVADVRPLLAAMDVFALPSTSVETFSNAALEAMAMGLPVVLSDIGGAREMISEAREGFIVPPGDDAALADALQKLCRDRTAREQMAAAARARVEQQFAFGRMVEAYRAIIAPAATGGGDRLSMAAT